MADAQGNSSASSSTLDSLSPVDDVTDVKHDTNPETGEEFFHDKEQEGDEGEGEGEEEEEDREEYEDEEDEEEEANLNSAAAEEENPFQVLICAWEFTRRAEIRRNLRALRGELDDPLNKRCTRCKLRGHVCLDCPLPLRFIPWHHRWGTVPQQNPVQPNEAHSPGQGQATSPSKGGCTGSSSQEVDPETAVPSLSSERASQLGKRKSESGSRTGSPTGKL
ncbi:histone H3.v1-like [Rhodamnia argentea]|uniref:Histone H3.v1-like n=1 Tax=Rhodamnia argentea TaxID=178133 RepID=A0A8B8PLR0_9MYRT|nr:histone H3.v1-like [Rhodamnia argentea]